MSARISSSSVWPGIVVLKPSRSSWTTTKFFRSSPSDEGSDRALRRVLGVMERGSSYMPATPPPEKP
jgi:hypothetical protein